jgi:hypothetical protein
MTLRGFFHKNPGAKHNYRYKLEVLGAKEGLWTAGVHFLKGQGLNYKNQGLNCKGFIWWKDRLANCKKDRGSLERLPAQP